MIKQTNPKLLPIIQEVGCYFITLIGMVNQDINDPVLYNQLWNLCKEQGVIDEKDNVDNPDKLLRLAYYLFGGKRVYQIGERKKDKEVFWNWVKNKQIDFIARCYRTTGIQGTHYVLCDREGNEVFDPYDHPYARVEVTKDILYQLAG